MKFVTILSTEKDAPADAPEKTHKWMVVDPEELKQIVDDIPSDRDVFFRTDKGNMYTHAEDAIFYLNS